MDRCIVSVDAKDQHGQVVGSKRYAVNSLVDELVDQQDRSRNFYHYPELEIWASLQSLFFQDLPRVSEILEGTDEGQHHMDIGKLVLLSDFLDGLTLQSENVRLFHVSEAAPVSQSWVRPDVTCFMFIFFAAWMA